MTENLETFQVILEERLPGRDHLIPWGEERFVTEMILQVDFPEGEASERKAWAAQEPHGMGGAIPQRRVSRGQRTAGAEAGQDNQG